MPRIYSINLGSGGSADPFTLIGRAQDEPIPQGVDTFQVTFTAPMADTTYAVVTSIGNLVDADPIYLNIVSIVKLTTGFTVRFNAPTDSPNYTLSFIAAGAL